MERILTPDEKIRRIEEIYYNRKIQADTQNSARVNVISNNRYAKLKKMTLQVLICLMLYIIFYMIKNYNYTFSNIVIDKLREALSYDIDFRVLYSEMMQVNYNNEEERNTEDNVKNNIENKEETDSDYIIEETLSITDEQNEKYINENEEASSSISQMEEDAKLIKSTCSFTKPLDGVVTSRYGEREVTSTVMSSYHTGIDIAREAGTQFVAAMSGTVEDVSSEGGYRKSYNNCKRGCFNFICTL